MEDWLSQLRPLGEDKPPFDRLVSWAWTIIANVSGGDWEKQTDEWQKAARAWADEVHGTLGNIDENG